MNWSYYFPFLLFGAILITGLITLLDTVFWRSGRQQQSQVQVDNRDAVKLPWYVEYSRSFFPVLVIVFIIRSFIIQPYQVPTGSLEPTVLPGDFLAVNQFAYGLRLPIIHKKILNIGEPHRGDIAVFRYPIEPKIDFVKRVIGIPGDHITYSNKTLYINGKEMNQSYIGTAVDIENGDTVKNYYENLFGKVHEIYIEPGINDNMTAQFLQNGQIYTDVKVPEGHYFVMGDNRDNSADSRFWGLVAEEYLVGKAFMIWFSWDSRDREVRWDRIGTSLT